MLRAGFAEMHLRVDDAGEDGEPFSVDDLAGVGRRQPAECCDPPVPDADIAHADPVMVHDACAANEEVEGLRHQAGEERYYNSTPERPLSRRASVGLRRSGAMLVAVERL